MGFFDYITKIDFSILYYIQEHLRCSFLDFLMPLFGFIQEGGMVWIVISIILICFKKTRYCGFAILLAMGIDTLITEFTLKNIICRARPCNIDFSIKMLVSRPDSYGFPSNHSASAFAAATALLVTLKKKRWAILGYILATAIALSRLYVFVHFPSDVLVGAIVGSLIALLVCLLMKKTGFKEFLIHKNIIER